MTEPEWLSRGNQKLKLAHEKAIAGDAEALSAYLDEFYENAGQLPSRSDVLAVLGWGVDRLEDAWNIAVKRFETE